MAVAVAMPQEVSRFGPSVTERESGIGGSGGPEADSWVLCPNAQAILKARLEALIPRIDRLEIESMRDEPRASNLKVAAGGCQNGADIKLTIVSWHFNDMSLLQRQRLVHIALAAELESGAIHSLPELRTLTPTQWRARQGHAHLAWVEDRLRSTISGIEHLEIVDVTNGHAVIGFHDGSKRALDPHGLELQLSVVSSAFNGVRPLDRQRLVGEALGPEVLSGAIHALPRMKTWTPAQWKDKQGSLANTSKTADADVRGGKL
eukprot:TRINITY_DN7382_c0_g1_i1.p1 TRINITY_DN7382_c0_g1~~TRINITY_DN7382_c0_g1_i1.p1  ORF type:complete len:262 (-),score=37.86 TRINITY_DN7382_c0_g1_i1:392-1177(-)